MTEAERYAFDVRGYLVRRGALSRREVAALNAAVDDLSLPPPADTIQSQRFTGHLLHSPHFVALLDHAAVFDVLVELCGAQLRLDHTYGIRMAPGTEGLGFHGGATPFDASSFYVVHNGTINCGLVAVQWCLVDQPREGGGFRCVPGSHKAAFAVPDSVPAEFVSGIDLVAGDVIIFTEALTHATAPWRLPYERRTLLYKYSPGNSSWGKDEVLPPELAPRLTPRQRLLFEPPYVAHRRSLLPR
jgi:ectoine hydroxylase-related dioxygenase (phytanoyl-CoA dioxygenase family)